MYTKKEFDEIKRQQKAAVKRAKKIKRGDIMYEQELQDPSGRGFFSHVVLDVDVDNCTMITYDLSVPDTYLRNIREVSIGTFNTAKYMLGITGYTRKVLRESRKQYTVRIYTALANNPPQGLKGKVQSLFI